MRMSVVKQMFAVLVSVGILSSLVLAGTYTLTQPRIEQNKRDELQEAIFVVLPEAKDCERNQANECQNIGTEEVQVYKGLNDQQALIGYAFVAEGPGFQGTISMIVGIEDDLDTLLGMKVLEQAETPGLGAKIAQETPKKDFYEQFTQLPLAVITPETSTTDVQNFVVCLKTDDPALQNDVQAITGATISSNAVASIINQHLMKLREIVQQTE
jgi:electron transport complex protein RnfG